MMFQIRIVAVAVLGGLSALSPAFAQQLPREDSQAVEQRRQRQNTPWILPVYRPGSSEETATPSDRSASAEDSAKPDVNLFDLSRHEVTFRRQQETPQDDPHALNLADYEPMQAESMLEAAGEAGHSAPGCEAPPAWENCCAPACPEFWEHRSSIYGEFLFLTPRGTDLSYALPIDGTGINAVPIGRAAVADPTFEPGFRVGGSWMLDPCTSLTANFTHYESHAFDQTSLPGGAGFLEAELVHPNTTDVATDSLAASASYDIDFELADINYKGIVWGGCDYALNYVLGFRYGRLEQDLRARYRIEGLTTVDGDIGFDGFGPRIGLEGERRICGGFLVYGKGFANFLAGQFDADYRQANVFSGTQVATGIEDERIVSLLELELGIGWQSKCGRVRATAGYYVGTWLNTFTMPDLIEAVQAENIDDVAVDVVDDTLTFDGLTTRIELRF